MTPREVNISYCCIIANDYCYCISISPKYLLLKYFLIFSFYQEIPASTTPDPESPSFDSSAVFLDELQFSSISQAGDTLGFGEGEFMEGLEFPDIEKDSDPEPEPSQPVDKSRVDNNSKQVTTKEGKSKELRDIVETEPSGTPHNGVSSSGNTDVSDYEMLDQSEAEGMTPTHETDNVDSAGGLRSVSNYLGKWLGY